MSKTNNSHPAKGAALTTLKHAIAERLKLREELARLDKVIALLEPSPIAITLKAKPKVKITEERRQKMRDAWVKRKQREAEIKAAQTPVAAPPA